MLNMHRLAIFVSFEYGILMIYSSGTIDKFRYDEMERQQPLSLSSMLKWENLRKWAGTIVCLVTFAYVMMTQMASVLHKEGYVAASSNDLVSTFFFGLFGLVCTGAFRDRFISEQARLSAEKVIAKENTSVRVATMALNASETATAVVDKERLLVMYNTAFQKMCCESDTDLRGKQLEGALNLSAEDTCALTNSFEDTGVREIQLTVSGKPVCIKAIASSMDPESFIEDNRYFHIVLRDLQRERDLAQAASLGQQEALKTLALVRDIEALSYMYNRPFLPEIDVVPNHIDDLADVEV